VYRRFGTVDADTSPLSARVAVALSESDEALHAIEAAPVMAAHGRNVRSRPRPFGILEP
jgi:hypothetical protein